MNRSDRFKNPERFTLDEIKDRIFQHFKIEVEELLLKEVQELTRDYCNLTILSATQFKLEENLKKSFEQKIKEAKILANSSSENLNYRNDFMVYYFLYLINNRLPIIK